MSYDVVFAKMDTSGNRGRVKLRIKVEFLGNGKIHEQELMLFFERKSPGDSWYMKLEDSLRNTQAEKGKKS